MNQLTNDYGFKKFCKKFTTSSFMSIASIKSTRLFISGYRINCKCSKACKGLAYSHEITAPNSFK